MTTIRASLIIPTHNRRDAILRALTAVANQTVPLDNLEVVVVADGCVDDTAVTLRQARFPFRLTLLEQPGLGPAAARNAGAAHAAGQILIFFDDDIEIVPEFVLAHLAAHQNRQNCVVMGQMPPAPQANMGFYEQGLQQWWRDRFSQMRQPGYRFGYDDLFSGNFSVPAALFSQVGGFDEALRCHEDYELGLRLIAADAAFAYADGAIGVHHDKTNSTRSMQRRRAEGEADYYLLQRVPELLLDLPIAQSEWTILQRAMRYSAFKAPTFGDAMARFQQALLAPLEVLWLRRLWWLLFAHLHDYWYWRGVAIAQQDPAAVAQLFVQEERPNPTPELTLDLAVEKETAVAKLDSHRPASLRLIYRDRWLADVSAMPGKERLHGGHLPRLLVETASFPWLLAQNELPGALPPVPAAEIRIEPEDLPEFEASVQPKKVIDVDVAEKVPALQIGSFSGVHALVRVRGVPVGMVTLNGLKEATLPAGRLARAIQSQLGHALLAAAWTKPAVPVELPPMSVVVCTRDRTAQLAHCLEALQALDYAPLEIIVVDNAPSCSDTAQLVAGMPVRYVREDRPGLDWARNRGLAVASHDLVAFTDDDARPDKQWLRGIAAAFADEAVTAVTGPVLPHALDTHAQNLFEFGYGGMNHGFARRVIRRTRLASAELLWASGYGVGANMALRRSHLGKIGEFDVALDVGTYSGGGGDVEMFHRVVARGGTLVYEPTALVWHQHRSDDADLRKLVQNNGRSFGCYLLTCVRNRTVGRGTIGWFTLRHWLWGWLLKRLLRPKGFPRRLILRELLAALGTPWRYAQAQRQARSAQRQATRPLPETSKVVKVRGDA